VTQDCIVVEPLPMKHITVGSEGDDDDSDVSMQDVSDPDYTVE